MRPMKKKWARWTGIALVVACSAFFLRQVTRLLSGDDIDLGASLPLFPLAICAYMAAYFAFGLGWHQLLAAAGSKRTYTVDLGIFTASQFAKYLPGNVGHHAGRVVLGARYGHPSYSVIATMVAELAMVLGAMVLLSLPSLEYWFGRFDLDARALVLSIGAVFAGGTLLLLLAFKLRHHARLQKLTHAFRQFSSRKAHSSLVLVSAFTAITAGIVLTAVSLGLLDKDWILLSSPVFPALLGVFAASWLLGFLVPGAPAGIGIRELVLTEGLAPLIGRDQSVLIALLFRVLSTACDLLAFMLGSGILWLSRKEQSKATL
jgi:glycosyltransferase 2 family protein